MKRSMATVLLSAFVFSLLSMVSVSEALGDIPALVNYQGRLLDSAGDPVTDGPYLIKFIIYDASTSGNELWNSSFQTVQVTDGLFDVRLGESPMPALPDTIFNTGADRWLGVTVSTDPEISPRTRFTASGYAYQTLRADTATTAKGVEDGVITLSDIAQNGAGNDQVIKWSGTQWIVADDDTGTVAGDITAVTTSGGLGGGGTAGDVDVYIATNGVTEPKILNNAVTQSKIANGAVTEGKIATGAVTATKIGTGAVTEDKIATDAVSTTKIEDGAVTESKIGSGAVTSTKIGTNAVQSTHINTNAVTTTKIMNSAVIEDKIANDAVTTNKIDDDAVNSNKILDASIRFADIGQNGAAIGQIMKWGGLAWAPAADDVGSAYGWADDGTVVRLLTATDSVGIGTVTPRGKLDVTGDLYVYDRATIGPGHTNTGTSAFVAGATNTVSGNYATVGGGENNTAGNQYATVGGGDFNGASGDASTVGGGRLNGANWTASTIAGGEQNIVDADHGAIGGGGFNMITMMADYGFIGGGADNHIEEHIYSVVSGGQSNWMMGPMSQYNVISGGMQNQMMDQVSFCAITGGSMNNIFPGMLPTDHSMLFGNQVDCAMPFEVLLFEATNFGALKLNCDDLDGPALGAITVGTNPGNGNGAFLSWGGAWTPGSSRDIKENFGLLDGKDVLNRIKQLELVSWNYIGSTERHIWPFAEDFVELFDVGVMTPEGTRDNKHLAAGDVAGVALVGVQQLTKENEELRQLVKELAQRIEQLEDANR